MAEIVEYRGGEPIARAAGSNTAGVPAYSVITNVVEASRIDGGAAVADTVVALVIPAGMLVQSVVVEVIDTQPTGTVNVGDAADPDGWVAVQAMSAAGYFLGGGAFAAGGKLYTADTDLLITPVVAALAGATLRVVVAGVHTG